MYLGAGISKALYPDGSYAWLMSSSNYVREALRNIKKNLKQNNLRFNTKLSDPNYSAGTPFCPIDYRSELDITMLCNDGLINYFQNLIGVLRWIVELGRIDIAFEVSSLSKFLSYPHTGYIYQALHIYKYLETHIDNDLSFDPMYHDFANSNQNYQKIDEMKKIYVNAKEELPTNSPKPREKSIQLNCFVDLDHAGERMTRRSQTGIFIFDNSAPLFWYSKKAKYGQVIYFWSRICGFTNCLGVDFVVSIQASNIWDISDQTG